MMLQVHKRGGFSDRNGINKEKTTIQLDDFDNITRNRMVSLVSTIYNSIYDRYYDDEKKQNFSLFILSEVYSEATDYRKIYDPNWVFDSIIETLSNDKYDSVLTMIESIAQYWDNNFCGYFASISQENIFQVFNSFFKKEYVGYRFIDKIIVRISDEIEISSINEAIDCPYDEVRGHLKKANTLLADRNNPDYENSIKESICAVEAICEIILNAKGKDATLGAMLKQLERNGVQIHSALKEAFNKLYGYTNDANGIRHAGDIGGPASTFEEAKFMLVSCCAFVNYLISIQAKITKDKATLE